MDDNYLALKGYLCVMKVTTINRSDTGFFSKQQLDMCYDQSVYSDFIAQPFSLAAFESQLATKEQSYSAELRMNLVTTLNKQYEGINCSAAVKANLELLAEASTFTVVTGHQMVVMTGPLYFIYKIAHAIRLSEELKKTYPTSDFVPVYWMASEDHDYEEIKSFHLFNRTISWETEQEGPVGRFELSNWEEVTKVLTELFQNHPDSELFQLLKVVEGEDYAHAFRKLVNHLFEKYGVIIVDGDDAHLKQVFLPYMVKEIDEQFVFKTIQETTDKLVLKGGKQQLTPREINFFYIEKGMRERLIANEDKIEIPQKGIFSKEEIVVWMHESPASFSPNAAMRPLYQEVILPNLCYIGGAGEINYWLQLKGVFDHAEVPFPILKIRNSVLWIDKNSAEKMEQLKLSTVDLFKELHVLTKEYLDENASDEVDFTDLDIQLLALKEQLIATTISVDASMESYAAAESVRIEKQVEQIKDRLYKTTKKKHDKNLKNLQQLKERLFPSNGFQERYANFLQLSPDGNYAAVIDEIVTHILPLSEDFILMKEE